MMHAARPPFLFPYFNLARRRAAEIEFSGSVLHSDPLNDISDCLDTGCGPALDPNLNKQKNIRSLAGEAEPMTIQEMRNLPDPVPGFKIGDSRRKLAGADSRRGYRDSRLVEAVRRLDRRWPPDHFEYPQ